MPKSLEELTKHDWSMFTDNSRATPPLLNGSSFDS
ncbi:hypothetical protein BofuT4_P053820.1 [Botrytis cinerea T4]|uniref:Uncharacterized protein n=1 Tax=Botryotinia fuckeliana (strain T4) TaxID=999810 RepID=G2XVG1_BOTF4|nr:hypothetical protein BofuT4_P053820.1 [Botrytis cinerea T4]